MTKKNNSTLKEENLVLPMSIEEALEIVKPLQNPIFKGEKLFDAINTLTALAEWHNSQDLIQREDVIDAHYKATEKDPNKSFRSWSHNIMRSIPKAKPPEGE